MAEFQKGHTKLKTAGRTKGTPNKKTAQWETFVEHCLNGGLKRFQEELNSLEGDKYVESYLKLLEYFKPKLARTEITGKDGDYLGIKWVIPNSEKDEHEEVITQPNSALLQDKVGIENADEN